MHLPTVCVACSHLLPVWVQMWGAGIVFFLANIAVLAQVLRHHVVVPVFVPRQGPQVCSVPAYYAKATKVSS